MLCSWLDFSDQVMGKTLHQEFRTAELEPELLPRHGGIETKWHVITGAPCSGKTTLIEQLAAKGYKTVPETGRRYIEAQLSKGLTIAEIRGDEAIFQRDLLDARLEDEGHINPSDLLFLDRALPDFITFYRANGLNPSQILPECLEYRYSSIFVLDRLKLEIDGVRKEDDATSDFLDEWLFRDYTALGYDVVRVPLLPIKERVDFILLELLRQGHLSHTI